MEVKSLVMLILCTYATADILKEPIISSGDDYTTSAVILPMVFGGDVYETISKPEKEPITFICGFQLALSDEFDNHRGDKVLWEKNGKVIAGWGKEVFHDFNRVLLKMDDSTNGAFFFGFKIISLEVEDQGEYTCNIFINSIEYKSNNSLHLFVEHLPPKMYPLCLVQDNDKLACLSEKGYPPVELQWNKDGGYYNNGSIQEQFVKTTINIDDTYFQCVMTYSSPTKYFERSCEFERPEIQIFSSAVDIGDTFKVSCLASHDNNPPVTSFEWIVKPFRNHTIESANSIYFSDITSSDNNTEIKCIATNAIGSKDIVTTIQVKNSEC